MAFRSHKTMIGLVLICLGGALAQDVRLRTPGVGDWPRTGKYGPGTRHLNIRNHLHREIHVEVLSGGASDLKSDAFILGPGKDTVYEVPNVWRASRLWGRTEAKQSGPSTLVEWTMGGRDWYHISLVDGYNLPVTVTPVPGTYAKSDSTDPFQCGSISCTEDLLQDCPAELRKLDGFGQVAQCLSACSKYNEDEFCCRGDYNSAESCKPATWEMDYPRVFKNACPTAVTYAFDDSSNTFVCPSGIDGFGPDYDIGFGALRASSEPTVLSAIQAGPRMSMRLEPGVLRYSGAPGGDLRVGLFDARGRALLERPITASAGSIPLPPLPRGAYRAVLYSGDGILETRDLGEVPLKDTPFQ
jgi:hypothetical protein